MAIKKDYTIENAITITDAQISIETINMVRKGDGGYDARVTYKIYKDEQSLSDGKALPITETRSFYMPGVEESESLAPLRALIYSQL